MPTAKDQIIKLMTSHYGETFSRVLLASMAVVALESAGIESSNT